VRAESYEGESGVDLLERIRMGLGSDETGAALNSAKLSVNGESDTQQIGGSAGNRYVPFANLDVLLNQYVERVIYVSPETGDTYIDAVEITGEEDLAIAGVDEIGPP
jgi:hypothetical protein